MSEPSREEVEAALRAIAAATTDLTLREMQRRALEAAAKVREGRERVVYKVSVDGCEQDLFTIAGDIVSEEGVPFVLKPGEELVIRPSGGKEQKSE